MLANSALHPAAAGERRTLGGGWGPPSAAITRYGLVRAFRTQVGTVAAPNPKRIFNGSSFDGILVLGRSALTLLPHRARVILSVPDIHPKEGRDAAARTA